MRRRRGRYPSPGKVGYKLVDGFAVEQDVVIGSGGRAEWDGEGEQRSVFENGAGTAAG